MESSTRFSMTSYVGRALIPQLRDAIVRPKWTQEISVLRSEDSNATIAPKKQYLLDINNQDSFREDAYWIPCQPEYDNCRVS